MDIDTAFDQHLIAQEKRWEWNQRISNAIADIEEAASNLNHRQITVAEAGRRIGLLAAQLEDLARNEPQKL